MLASAVLGLVNNAALLLALGVLYDLPGFGRPRGRPALAQAATGLVLGGMSIVIMLTPWQFGHGVVFDTRSVLLSLSGLFFGAFPALIAALIAAAFRLSQGGAGAWTGVLVIFVSGAIGVIWRHVRARRVDQIRRAEFYLFGWVVHVAMLLCMFTLPKPLPSQVLPAITVPVLAIYPVATALMGWLLGNRERRRRLEAEREAALDALRASETRLRGLYDHMSSGVAIYEAQGDGENFVIRDLNEAALRITGVRREDVFGRLVTDVFPGVRDMGLFDVFQRVWKTGVPEHHAATLYRDERLTFWAENYVYKLPSGELVAIFDDITQRKQAEEQVRRLDEAVEQRVAERVRQLQAANQELKAFIYSVSHDLKAPLRAINEFSRIAVEEHAAGMGQEGARLLGIVRDNARAMTELIDALLNLSRVGRQELRRVRVDMTRLAQEVAEDLRTQTPGRTLEFRIGPLPDAHGDRALLRQVFTNLLSNAVKFTRTREVAVIEVDGWTENGENTYVVRDNGVGFPMEYADKLFDVFQRLHSAEEYEGTGVGLAIVQRIVLRHGGRVWAESEPDRGAAFYFALPAPPENLALPRPSET